MTRQARMLDSAACVARLSNADLSGRELDDVATVFGEAFLGALIGPVTGPLRTMLAELERVQTADPTLRSGRAAWRQTVTAYAGVRPLPNDFCARVDAWVGAGLRAEDAPHLQSAAVRALLMSGEDSERWEAKQRRAVARMEALGVPSGQARRFLVDAAWRGIVLADPED